MSIVDLDIHHKLLPFMQVDKRVKIAVGGRGSGKSLGVAGLLLTKAWSGATVLCTRQYQNSINDSVYAVLCQEIDRLDWGGWRILRDEILSPNGGRIFFRGLERNITSVKSLGGVNICAIEEGESVSDRSLRVLTPSIRSKAGADGVMPEVWICMNRGSSQDAVAKRYLERAERTLHKEGYYEDEEIIVVQMNYDDNPWFPPELELERKSNKQRMTDAEYRHTWLGEYYDSVPNCIIRPEWFDSCLDAHLDGRFKRLFEPKGAVVAGFDPGGGDDDSALSVRHGSIIKYCDTLSDRPIDENADWACSQARGFRPELFVYDSDGMGGGLKRHIDDAFKVTDTKVVAFRGGMTDGAKTGVRVGDIKRDYRNNRAYYYSMLADRMFATHRLVTDNILSPIEDLISIDTSGVADVDGLRSELCRLPLVYNANGLVQLMSKPDMMSKHNIPSPNMADSLMMSCLAPQIRRFRTVKKPRLYIP